MKIDGKTQKTADGVMEALKEVIKTSDYNSKQIAEQLELDPKEFRAMFTDASMPYVVFQAICNLTRTKATDVFAKAREIILAKRAANKAKNEPVTEANTPADGQDETKTTATVKPAKTEEAGPDHGGEVDATGDDDVFGDGQASTAESAPGVPLIDDSTPQAKPFDFKLADEDSGMTAADMVIMHWADLRDEALANHTRPYLDENGDEVEQHLTGAALERRRANYPKPSKDPDDPQVVVITYPIDGTGDEAIKNAKTKFLKWVNDGYLRELQEVIDKRKMNVTLRQASYK